MYYVRGSVRRGRDGAAVSWDWKCWAEVGAFRWDMVRIGTSLYCPQDDADQGLFRWWKSRLPQMLELFHSLGMDTVECYVPSRKSQDASARFHGRHAVFADRSHDVGTFSTEAVIVMLRLFQSSLRTLLARSNAESVSRSFYETLLPENIYHAFAWAAVPVPTAAACDLKGDADRCEHLAAAIACFTDKEVGSCEAAFCFWAALADQATHCPSCREWGLVVLQQLARQCEARVPEIAYTDDPLKSARPRELTGCKRSVEDEDYKRAVTSKVIQEGRAETPNAYLRATGDHVTTSADGWVVKELANHRAASVLSAQEVRSCSVSADATRIGNPAEDVLAVAAWVTTPLLEFGSVVPPQARIYDIQKCGLQEYGTQKCVGTCVVHSRWNIFAIFRGTALNLDFRVFFSECVMTNRFSS